MSDLRDAILATPTDARPPARTEPVDPVLVGLLAAAESALEAAARAQQALSAYCLTRAQSPAPGPTPCGHPDARHVVTMGGDTWVCPDCDG